MVLLPGCKCCGTGCEKCQTSQCCGTDWPATNGVCCNDEWHSEPGNCCGDEWHDAAESGECCGFVVLENAASPVNESVGFYDAAAEQNLRYAQPFAITKAVDTFAYVRLYLWRNPDSEGTFNVYIYDNDPATTKPNAQIATVAEGVSFEELGTGSGASWKKTEVALGTTLTNAVPGSYTIYWVVVIADNGHGDLFWTRAYTPFSHAFGGDADWDGSGSGLGGRLGTDRWHTDDGVCCEDKWHPEATEPGKCCNGVWHPEATDPGECCAGTWHANAVTPGSCCNSSWYVEGNECTEYLGEAFVFFVIPNLEPVTSDCCLCIPQDDVDAGQGPDDITWCCDTYGGYPSTEGQCRQRCCVDHECTLEFPADCDGESLPGGCWQGCPAGCCTESADGDVSCATIDSGLCYAPSVVDTAGCEEGCLGECCIDGVSQGQTTQAACAGLGGTWGGLGSTTCVNVNECRPPFSTACCESKQSTAAGLTFTQPRNKRTPAFADTLRVTVTGTTDSPILVHGTPFGVEEDPPKRCPFQHTFDLCWDSFNIEPVPCGSTFRNLDVTVCWEEHDHPTETLNFSGCNGITAWLGNCQYNCITTLVYSGSGQTSNASIVTLGNAYIEANGGALVLTSPVTHQGSCNRTLTLTGTSTAENEIGVIEEPGGGGVLTVYKGGNGVWRFAGLSEYSGKFSVLSGTAVIAANVSDSGPSPFGVATADAALPSISGGATLLLADGVNVQRGFSTTGNGAVLGGFGTGSSTFTTGAIGLGGNVTLQAATGGTVTFAPGAWTDEDFNPDPAVAITIGSVGNAGTVLIDETLPSSITAVTVAFGTARLTSVDDRIDPGTPVSVGSATLVIDGISQTLESLSFTGTGSLVTDGTLRLSGAAATVVANGADHEIASAVVLDSDATFEGGGELTVSGIVSGASGLTKDGSGTLTLSAANTYTGDTTISAGTLLLSGSLAAGSELRIDAATLECSGGEKAADAVVLTGAATIKGAIAIGDLSGTGSLVKAGTGTLRLTGSNTMSGSVSVTGGTLEIESIVSGPAIVSLATLTPSALTVVFTADPDSADEYVLLAGPTTGWTGSVTLTGTSKTGTYDATTSTLTID